MPNPELMPIQRPRCPKCEMRMVTIWSRPEPDGLETRAFECLKCGHTETRSGADPMKAGDVSRWISGQLGKPH